MAIVAIPILDSANSRLKECGIADAARDEFVRHSLGALGNAYTDLSDEYLRSEGIKFKY